MLCAEQATTWPEAVQMVAVCAMFAVLFWALLR